MSTIKAGPQTLIFDGNVPPAHPPAMHENAVNPPVVAANIDGSDQYLVAYQKSQDPYDVTPGPQRWAARIVMIDPDALTLTPGPELVGPDGTAPLGIVPFTAGKAVIVYSGGTGFTGLFMQTLHVSGTTLTSAGEELDLTAAIVAVHPDSAGRIGINQYPRTSLLVNDAPYGVYFNFTEFDSTIGDPDSHMYHVYVTQVDPDDLTLTQLVRSVDYPDHPTLQRLIGTGAQRMLTYMGQKPDDAVRVPKCVPVTLWRPSHGLTVGTPVVVAEAPTDSSFWEQWGVFESSAGPIALLLRRTGYTSFLGIYDGTLIEYTMCRPTITPTSIMLGAQTVISPPGDQVDGPEANPEDRFAVIDGGVLMARTVFHSSDTTHGSDVSDREYSLLDAVSLARTKLLTSPFVSPYGFSHPPGYAVTQYCVVVGNGSDKVLVVTNDAHVSSHTAEAAFYSVTGQVLSTANDPILTLGAATARVVA
jgi:hypothetical protein